MPDAQPARVGGPLPRGHLLVLNRSFRRTLEAENKSPRTVEAYTDAVRFLALYCEAHGKPLLARQLQREHIQDFIADQRLLRATGFGDITERDVTSAFAATVAAWLAETEPYAEVFARLEAPGAFALRQADRRTMLAAIHAGLLRRALLLARTREGSRRR